MANLAPRPSGDAAIAPASVRYRLIQLCLATQLRLSLSRSVCRVEFCPGAFLDYPLCLLLLAFLCYLCDLCFHFVILSARCLQVRRNVPTSFTGVVRKAATRLSSLVSPCFVFYTIIKVGVQENRYIKGTFLINQFWLCLFPDCNQLA